MLLGSSAWGEEADSTTHDEVVVTGERQRKPASPKYTQPLRDIPQTITVIPQEAMREQGATTLRDVLRNVPGISIQAGEGGVPAGDNLSIRGFNARTDVFINGVRDFGGYSRDPFNIEQVEVVKGPASSYAGRGSTGGAINMVTKQPKLEREYAGSLGVGSSEYKRGTVDLNQPLGGLGAALRVNAVWTDGEFPGRSHVTNERWGVAPTLALGLGTPTRLTLGYFRLDQDNMPDYGIPWVPNTNTALTAYRDQPPPVNFSNFYGLNNRDYEDTNTDVGYAEIVHDFGDSASLRNYTQLGRTLRDSIITAPRFAANNSTAINRNLQSRDQTDTIAANQTDLTLKFGPEGLNHSLVTGVEFAREESVNHARSGPTASQTDLFAPNPDDAYPGPVTRTGARNEAEAKSVGVYAFDTLEIGERWELLGGLRWDSFDVDYLSVSSVTAAPSTTLTRTDKMLSWRAGIVFKPLPASSIYLAYGTSFNPSAEGLTLGNTATAANGIDTDPEESRTVELGTKWDFLREMMSFNAAVFETKKINARTEDPANAADVIVLEGEQRVRGVEVGGAGRVTRAWTLFGGYAFLDSEVAKSKNPVEIGRDLSNTPRNSFSLWTTYELPAGFEIGAGAQYVGDRVNSTTAPRLAEAYWLADAMLAWRLNQNLGFRLNGYNLGDKTYIDRVGGGHFIPGAGPSAVLTTDFTF